MGTWIEIDKLNDRSVYDKVVPYVGTWIEIYIFVGFYSKKKSRSLRGNVDRNSATLENPV